MQEGYKMASTKLSDADYAVLADFRYSLRNFMSFSEEKALEYNLTPQQHQALLAIRAAPEGVANIGYVADRLVLKPHSASGLIARLETLGLLHRKQSSVDKRQTVLILTDEAEHVLSKLSVTHREEIRRLKPLLLNLLTRIEDE